MPERPGAGKQIFCRTHVATYVASRKGANSITMPEIQQASINRPLLFTAGRALRGALASACMAPIFAFAGPLDPPSPEVLREARAIVEEMKAAERGPYTRIRWFCKDGTVQPPAAFACKERGGGRQHAE